MRVLVTRPAHAGERTAKKLKVLGHEALLMPLTQAIHDVEAARNAIATSTGAIAVTSAEAIRTLRSLGAELTSHLGRPVFAVGKATAEEALDAGFTTVPRSDGDGATLADLIAANRTLLGEQPLTYIAGQPRAAGLEKRLTASGVEFTIFECYRMELVEPPKAALQRHLHDDRVDAVLFYSRHTAEVFFGLDDIALLKNIRLLCLSATIATIVPQDLASNVEIADTPDEESLLQLLGAGEGPILI